MSWTFDVVDRKVAESEYFLRRMNDVGCDMFKFRCYFSAFLAASRTITLSLQRASHIPGFDDWYAPHRQTLAKSELARFFLEQRNTHIHGDEHPIGSGDFLHKQATYWFADRNEQERILVEIAELAGEVYEPVIKTRCGVPKQDAVTASRNYFKILLAVVYDCYVKLGPHIDPQQYYTKEQFSSIGRSIEAAEVGIWGVVRTGLVTEGYTEEDRWCNVRANAGHCQINHIFKQYLGKKVPTPPLPEGYEDFQYEDEVEECCLSLGELTINEHLTRSTINDGQG